MKFWAKLIVGPGLATLLGSVSACSNDGPTPPNRDQLSPPVVLSDTSAAAAGAWLPGGVGSSLESASDVEVTYVSLPPGSVPDGKSAVINNLRTQSSVTTFLTAGGFDPVAVAARSGDAIETTVFVGGGSAPVVVVTVVPAMRRPSVVRTVPPRGKTDVPLNSVIEVVFSEPIRGGTLTAETVRLRLLETVVNGRLERDPAGLMVRFVPDEPLSPNASYSLTVTEGVRDLDGDALESQVEVPFTTTGIVEPPVSSELQLAFAGTLGIIDASSRAVYSTDIYVKKSGAGAIRLTSDPAVDTEPSWSPDRARIAFRSERDGNAEIYAMDSTGKAVVRLTTSAAADYHPAWSPDGSRIAFVSERDGNAEIYVMTTTGADVVRLTTAPASDRSPNWSPDGQRIAFSSERDGKAEIYLMNADGSNVVRLTNNDVEDGEPAWSPDGTRIAFSRDMRTPSCLPLAEIDEDAEGFAGYGIMCRWDVLVMNADGSGATRLDLPLSVVPRLPSGWWQGVFIARDPTWTPDGRQIAVSAFYCLSDFGGADCHGNYPILVLSSSGTGGFVEFPMGVPPIDYRIGPQGASPAWRP